MGPLVMIMKKERVVLTIQQCAPSQVHIYHSAFSPVRAPCILNILAKAVICNDTVYIAQLAILDQLSYLDADWEEAGPDCFHEEQLLFFCGCI